MKQTTNNFITALDLPKDILLGFPNISLCGNREVYISNHKGILSYGQDEMIVLVKDYQLAVRGKQLTVISYSKEDLTIHGHVFSLEFM